MTIVGKWCACNTYLSPTGEGFPRGHGPDGCPRQEWGEVLRLLDATIASFQRTVLTMERFRKELDKRINAD
jgi:hypothetical protein